MFAVIKSGGRQYKVSVGQTLQVNRLHVEDGAKVTFDEVLLISDENSSMIGTPYVADALVTATAVGPARGKKLIVFKYKAKKRYRHRRGHRQELTVLTIDDIIAEGKSLITGEAPKSEEDVEEEEVVETTAATTTSEEAGAEETTSEEASDEETTSEETDAEKRPSRRRRTAKAEDTESETEE
jgi:large subunit ribosomal protein L21